jgi:hypothetical protein
VVVAWLDEATLSIDQQLVETGSSRSDYRAAQRH